MEVVEETMAAPTRDFWRVDLETLTALTFWNTQVQARGRDVANAMAWDDFEALLTMEFCPSNKIEKLEGEFWNHSMVGANHARYTDRFHELAKLVLHLVTPKAKRVTRYINGLPSQIRGMVQATQPATIGILTDEVVRSGTLAKAGEKRKERDDVRSQKVLERTKRKLKGREENYIPETYKFDHLSVESHKDGSKEEPSAREQSTMVGSYRIIVMSSVIIFRRE
nr:reverse transcriptase domain-containing protein [Tanacetum cinerariifolium]